MRKMQTHPTVESVYKGESGRQYSKAVLETSEEYLQAISRNRFYKLKRYFAKNDTVLEIGVGLGVNLRLLDVRDRVGYDIGEYGKGYCESFGIRFVSKLDCLGDEQFSRILLHHVLEHVPNPLGVILDAKSRLVKGGKILIFIPNEIATRERNYKPGDKHHHIYSWSPMTIGNLVASSGFVVDKIMVGPFGYERFAAPLNRIGFTSYRLGLKIMHLVRPVSEIIVVATAP
jgi:hypothetical protein